MKMKKMKTETYEVKVPESLAEFKNWQFSSGTTTGKDFDRFCRLYKKFVKDNIPEGAELVEFNKGHYILSGFVKEGENLIYFSVCDVRYNKNEWVDNILVRTAKSKKDFTGGRNCWTDLEHFEDKVNDLLK